MTLEDLYMAELIEDKDYINILTISGDAVSGNDMIWRTGRWFNDNILQHIKEPIMRIDIETQEPGEPAVFTIITREAADLQRLKELAETCA